MRLISCSGCGVVLDADVLGFSGVRTHDEHGQPIPGRVYYDGDEYMPVVDCPNCGDAIAEDGSVQHFCEG